MSSHVSTGCELAVLFRRRGPEGDRLPMTVDGHNQFGDCAGIVADDGKRRSWATCKGKGESEALPTIQSLHKRSETSKEDDAIGMHIQRRPW